MTQTELNISGRNCHIISTCNKPSSVIIKPLGEFERLLLMDECRLIAELTAETFSMIAFEVTEKDLRPEGAEDTFLYLRDEILPYVKQHIPHTSVILGGYSLGGLFALWSATRQDCIDAVFAGSPSLWMDGWDEYAKANPVKAKFVYMSLGDKEETTKKMPYHIIGDRVRQQHQLHLSQLGESNCTLEWNSGGHFADIEQRKAKGFAWCLNKLRKMEITLRNAQPADCQFVALGICMALHMVPNESMLPGIAKICLREDVLYSYRHAIIAFAGETPVGLCLCYDGGKYHEMRKTTFPLFDELFGDDSEHEEMDLENAEDEATEGEYYMDSLSVLPEWRRKGIATMLMQAQIDRAKELGFKKATLLVDPVNTSAQGAYRKLGFEDDTQVYAFGQIFWKWVKNLH